MANATTTIAGDIQLAGDLTGTATSPQLAASGVTAGFYAAANLTVDAKGRVTAVTAGIPEATTSTKGVVQIGSGLSVTGGVISVNLSGSIPNATTSTKGIVQIGTGVNVSSGVISIPDATTSTKGMVTTADSTAINISAGVMSIGTNIPKLNTSNTFTAGQWIATSALTSSTSITANLSLSNNFTLTLAHYATLTPTGLGVGKFVFIVKQNATGGFSLTFSSAFKFPTGADTTIATAANSVTIIEGVCNGTNIYCSAPRKGFA